MHTSVGNQLDIHYNGPVSESTHNLWRPDFAVLGAVFAPLAAAAAPFKDHAEWPTLAEYSALARSRGVTTDSGLAVTFVPPAPKPRRGAKRRQGGEPSYEERIAALGEVPTRASSWHDFFNVLVWSTFPRTKAALNARQIAAREPETVRSREQQVLAMFDEGGVVSLRGPDGQVETFVVGHALYESVLIGRLDVWAMTRALELPAELFKAPLAERLATADTAIAARVADGRLARENRQVPATLLRSLL